MRICSSASPGVLPKAEQWASSGWRAIQREVLPLDEPEGSPHLAKFRLHRHLRILIRKVA